MASSFSNQNFRVGDQIGDYRLVRFIGSGGMGEVYEAEHSQQGVRGAIKFLRPDHTHRADLLARFEQEARFARTLESRHIVRVRECHVTDVATPYMIMDLAEGQSLASILAQDGHIETARALDFVHQACVGLSVAHLRRIIHRDLKPDNLYICPLGDGTELLKILDFGIAKHLGATEAGPTTETGSNLGTAHYMSPEQAQGAKHAIDHRTDLYSLGVILYEMLSGRRPHQGESYNEILIRIVTQRPVPLDVLCPNLPRELFRIVARAMQRDPCERFQSASEFAQAVARLMACGIESTASELVLHPATAPRSPDLATLDTGSNPTVGTELLQTLLSSGQKPLMPRNRNAQQTETGPATVGKMVLVALFAVAMLGLPFAWLHGKSQHRKTAKAIEQPSLTLLPATTAAVPTAPIAGRGAVATDPASSVQFPAEGVSALPRAGLEGAPIAPAPPLARSPEIAARTRRASTPSHRKAPGIDDPLPPNPHAPGVSTVME